MIEIDATSFNRYAIRLTATSKEIPTTYLPTSAVEASNRVVEILRRLAPKRAGLLASSFLYVGHQGTNDYWVEFLSALPDARMKPWWQARTAYWQTRGTRPVIKPTHAKRLRVPLRGGGYVYLKQVRGQAPNQFDVRAANQADASMGVYLTRTGLQIVTKLSGTP